jgi:hypothetical protein
LLLEPGAFFHHPLIGAKDFPPFGSLRIGLPDHGGEAAQIDPCDFDRVDPVIGAVDFADLAPLSRIATWRPSARSRPATAKALPLASSTSVSSLLVWRSAQRSSSLRSTRVEVLKTRARAGPAVVALHREAESQARPEAVIALAIRGEIHV